MSNSSPNKGVAKLEVALARLGSTPTAPAAGPRTRLHPEYDADATWQDVLDGERELDREHEASAVVIAPAPPHDPADPNYQDYCRCAREWRTAILEGRVAGPRPEPPAAPQVDPEDARRFLRAKTRLRRHRLQSAARKMVRKHSSQVSGTMPRPVARARGAGRPRAQAARSCARSGDSGDDGGGGSSDDGSSVSPGPPSGNPDAFSALFGELAAGDVQQVPA